MSCNGICIRYKAKRNHDIPYRYKEGQKRCSVCEIFLSWNETAYCPCCNYKLRTRSFRGWEMRKKYRELFLKDIKFSPMYYLIHFYKPDIPITPFLKISTRINI